MAIVVASKVVYDEKVFLADYREMLPALDLCPAPQQEQQLGLPSEEVMMAPPAMAQMQLESSDGQDPYASEDFNKYLPQSAQVDQQTPTWDGGRSTYEPPTRARQCISKLQSGFMIGASLGGLASMLAEGRLRPGTLSGLVLVDVTPRLDRGGVERIISFMSDRMHEGFATVEEAADAIAGYLPHRKRPDNLDGLSKNLRLHEDGRYRWHWDPAFISARAHDDRTPADIEGELIAAAAALKLPVLLVRGARSELVTDAHVEEFLELVPHASHADVKGAGHMVAGDRNDAFADEVLGFLERMEAA